jgi:MFS family permease
VLTPPVSATLPLLRRTLRVLVVAQLLGALGLAAGGTAGALLAEHLTGNPAAAGLPLSLLVLGSGVGVVAVARIMREHGRRAGLAVAYLAGTVGAGLPLATGGLGLLGLVAAAPCLLILAAVATTHKRHPGSVAGARSGSGNTTHVSVPASPD